MKTYCACLKEVVSPLVLVCQSESSCVLFGVLFGCAICMEV